ncbi:hypothetical protein M8J76_003144 [Diaphorina citri]|nr:hypothetical protein M8J76_003144 [Diaphorina citri]
MPPRGPSLIILPEKQPPCPLVSQAAGCRSLPSLGGPHVAHGLYSVHHHQSTPSTLSAARRFLRWFAKLGQRSIDDKTEEQKKRVNLGFEIYV